MMTSSRTLAIRRARIVLAGLVAAAGVVVGLGAPAVALTRYDRHQDFTEGNGGNESARWKDAKHDAKRPHVTVKQGCNRDFTVRIREDRTLLPDVPRGSEKVNCTSSTDAVYADSGINYENKFHYDGTGIGLVSAKPYVPKHAKFDAVVLW